MRFLLALLLMILLAALAEYWLPWWSLAVVAFGTALLMRLAPGKAFLAGFTAIVLLWAGWALWWDLPNEHLLSGRMAKLFALPGSAAFIAVTALIGGTAGGLSAWSGAHLRKMMRG